MTTTITSPAATPPEPAPPALFDDPHSPTVTLQELEALSPPSPPQIPWLWPSRFPLGQLSLIVSHPGVGKSLLSTDIAARVSAGSPWPDSSPDDSPAPKGAVVLAAREDDALQVILPRLRAAGADASQIHVLKSVYNAAKCAPFPEIFFNLRQYKPIEDALDTIKDCRLVVFDPIVAFFRDADFRHDGQVRELLSPLVHLAQRHNTAILLLHHLQKRTTRFADQSILGSSSFASVCRNVWHLLPCPSASTPNDPQRDSRRILVPGKSNLSRRAPALAFTITTDSDTGAARVMWDKDPIDVNADQALNKINLQKSGPEPVSRMAAQTWLTEVLKDGPVIVPKLRRESDNAGLTWRTLQRAADYLALTRKKVSEGYWTWELPLQT